MQQVTMKYIKTGKTQTMDAKSASVLLRINAATMIDPLTGELVPAAESQRVLVITDRKAMTKAPINRVMTPKKPKTTGGGKGKGKGSTTPKKQSYTTKTAEQ